ncbi:MAG: sensor histidine kinase [Proteobacteria bacterium]|nr:sensor histidine kinase [Pseudomonadota bacterium]
MTSVPHLDILSVGSLHEAVLAFSSETSLAGFWSAVALNTRWVLPAARVCILCRTSDNTCEVVGRFQRGGHTDLPRGSFPVGEDAVSRALRATRPRWLETPWVDLPETDQLRSWLRSGQAAATVLAVPLSGPSGSAGSLVFEFVDSEAAGDKARLGALASLYARHAASAHLVIKSMLALEEKNRKLEQITEELGRTSRQVQALNETLEQRIDERTKELAEVQLDLLEISRRAGMAEVAAGILHNVGNVLNSINVSAQLLSRRVESGRVRDVQKVVDLLDAKSSDLASFLTSDPRGAHLIPYLRELAKRLVAEQNENLSDLVRLRQHVEHVNAVIADQQAHATTVTIIEQCEASELVEDALVMSELDFAQLGIEVIRPRTRRQRLAVDRHKVLQILINLVTNAKQALQQSRARPKQLIVDWHHDTDRFLEICVSDNGVGITREDCTKIFTYGFSTKKDGHGFGLHASALAAGQLGGSLTCRSDGPGRGATFVLKLPITAHRPRRVKQELAVS